MAFVFLKKPILQKIELKTKVACQKRLGCFDFNTRAFEQPWLNKTHFHHAYIMEKHYRLCWPKSKTPLG
jgi:hypothetical protein